MSDFDSRDSWKAKLNQTSFYELPFVNHSIPFIEYELVSA